MLSALCCIVSFYYDCSLPLQQLKVGLGIDALRLSSGRGMGLTEWLSPGHIFRLVEDFHFPMQQIFSSSTRSAYDGLTDCCTTS